MPNSPSSGRPDTGRSASATPFSDLDPSAPAALSATSYAEWSAR